MDVEYSSESQFCCDAIKTVLIGILSVQVHNGGQRLLLYHLRHMRLSLSTAGKIYVVRLRRLPIRRWCPA